MAFQYANHPETPPEQIEDWGAAWNGCRYWGSCRGTACAETGKDGGRSRWGSPVKYPRERPSGIHPERARATSCPNESVAPDLWGLIHTWSYWRLLGGMPSAGALDEQSARVCEAFAVLDAESDLLAAYHSEEAIRRSKVKR